MNAARLYTPEILALATSLADFPALERPDLQVGNARSATCGSAVEVGLALGPAGKIAAIGVRAQACAIGQAAAAVFARGATGWTAADVEEYRVQIGTWLEGGGPLPDWPELAVLAAARDYPARHGALQLAWKAACAALATSVEAS